MSTTAASPPRTRRFAGLLGAGLMWFGVLGGVAAWAIHLFVAWGTVEVACTQGNTEVLGMSVRTFAGWWTGGPAVVAVLSLVAALYTARRESTGGARDRDRARFLAHLGAWLDVLALFMIAFGAVAIVGFEPCQS